MSFTRYQAERECLRRALNDVLKELSTLLQAGGHTVPPGLPRHLKAIGAQSRKRPGKTGQWEWFIE